MKIKSTVLSAILLSPLFAAAAERGNLRTQDRNLNLLPCDGGIIIGLRAIGCEFYNKVTGSTEECTCTEDPWLNSAPSEAPSTSLRPSPSPSYWDYTPTPTTSLRPSPSPTYWDITPTPSTPAPSTSRPSTSMPSTSAPSTDQPSTSMPSTSAPSTNQPTASSSPTVYERYVKLGEGLCQDASNNYFSWVSAHIKRATDETCFNWCDQNPASNLIGAQIRNDTSQDAKRCYCLFSGYIPAGLEVSSAYSPSHNQVKSFSGVGEVQGVHESPDIFCYRLNNTPEPSFSPTVTPRPSTIAPSTGMPSTDQPSTSMPSSSAPSTDQPSTFVPSTSVPSTLAPSTNVPTTSNPTEIVYSTGPTPVASSTDQPTIPPVSATLSPHLAVPSGPVSASQIGLFSITGEPLQFFEVQVFSSGNNVAFGATAWQSSNYKDKSNFNASMAIDGDEDSFSHTSTSDASPSWTLLLGDAKMIDSINILNRWCGDESDPHGCYCRLSGANIYVRDYEIGLTFAKVLGNTCGQSQVTVSFEPSPSSSPTYLDITPTPSTPVPSTSQPSTPMPSTSAPSTEVNKVRVESTTGEQLQFFELEILSSSSENVALQGTASQSSTRNGNPNFAASNCIDSDRESFCHTDDATPWFEVELTESVEIDSIVIINRYCQGESDVPRCLCRLTGAIITLYDHDVAVATRQLGDTCGKLVVSESFSSLESPSSSSPTTAAPVSISPTSSPTKSPTETSSGPLTVTEVWITTTTGEPLQFFEVQVFSSDVNVAPGGIANQSSTHQNKSKFAASRAVDGLDDTFSHTSSDADAHWYLFFSEAKTISHITILNRWCGDESDPHGCYCRLSGATLYLIDGNYDFLASRTFGNTCGQSQITESFAAPAAPSGNKIRIESTTGEQLQMYELEIYSNGSNVALQGTASQSSTRKGNPNFAASKCIDNDAMTFCHTDDPNAWFEVKLSESVEVDSLIIHNRYCQGANDVPGCLCRLSYAMITLYDDNVAVATKQLGDTCGEILVSMTFD